MLGNTNHRGKPVGAPHAPTQQSEQAQNHPRFTAPNAGVEPSFGEAQSPAMKTTSFTDIASNIGTMYTKMQDKKERDMDRAMTQSASTPASSPASSPSTP